MVTVEDIALEVYAICRERTNSTKECLDLIAKKVIKSDSLMDDSILEDKIQKYRRTYKGLEDLSKYVYEKVFQTDWKSLV